MPSNWDNILAIADLTTDQKDILRSAEFMARQSKDGFDGFEWINQNHPVHEMEAIHQIEEYVREKCKEQLKSCIVSTTSSSSMSSTAKSSLEISAVKNIPAQNVDLYYISGAPGSGKSYLDRLIPDDVYRISADQCKFWIKEAIDVLQPKYHVDLAAIDPVAAQSSVKTDATSLTIFSDPRWKHDGFIHRWSSVLAWGMLPEVLEKKVPMAVETLGRSWQIDQIYLEKIAQHGYRPRLWHVATSTHKAIESAVSRFFSSGCAADQGRHIAISNLPKIQKECLTGFMKLVEWASHQDDFSFEAKLIDNREWKMREMAKVEKTILSSDINPKDDQDGSIEYHVKKTGRWDVSCFMSPPMGNKLWFSGANHTADLLLFAPLAPPHHQSSQSQISDVHFENLSVALIRRGQPPFQGKWALPGGFVNTAAQKGEAFVLGLETPEAAARREFYEETMGEFPSNHPLVSLGKYDHRWRDPRNSEQAWVVSHAFSSFLPHPIKMAASGQDDATETKWVSVVDILSRRVKLAFDHEKMVLDALDHHHPNWRQEWQDKKWNIQEEQHLWPMCYEEIKNKRLSPKQMKDKNDWGDPDTRKKKHRHDR